MPWQTCSTFREGTLSDTDIASCGAGTFTGLLCALGDKAAARYYAKVGSLRCGWGL